jgi:parvulin-like peptidyl-prolyl isomerase
VRKRRATRALGLAAALCLAAASCSHDQAGGGPASASQAVATVNGAEISAASLKDHLRAAAMAARGHTVTAGGALESMINSRLLEQEAVAKGYREDEALRREVQQYIRRTLPALYVQSLRRDFIASQEVDAEKIQGELEAAAEPTYRASVILLESLEEAPRAYERLRAGEPFADVAREMSVGISAPLGGDLGQKSSTYFTEMFGIDIEEYDLEAGSLSNPIETAVGYIILYLKEVTLSQDLEKLMGELIAREQEKAGRGKFDEEILDGMIRSVPARYNKAKLEQGALRPEVITGVAEEMPEDVFARLGDFEVTREIISSMYPRLPAPRYVAEMTRVLEAVLMQEHFYRKALEEKPDLMEDPGFKDLVARQEKLLMRKKLVYDMVESKVQVDETEVDDYYRTNISLFMHPDQWELSHIIVEDREKAERVVEMFRAGAPFDLLAKQFSLGGKDGSGTDLGRVERGRLIPPLDAALEGMQEGEISPVIKSEFGFHILKCRKFIPAASRTRVDAREEIVQAIRDLKTAKGLEAYQRELRAKADVRIDQEILEGVKEEMEKERAASPHGGITGGGMGGGMRPSGHP